MISRTYGIQNLPSPNCKKLIEATDGSKGHENEVRNAAFETHALFQDAVCFYIAALATCAPETSPVKETVRTRFHEIAARLGKHDARFLTSFNEFGRLVVGERLRANQDLLVKVFNKHGVAVVAISEMLRRVA